MGEVGVKKKCVVGAVAVAAVCTGRTRWVSWGGREECLFGWAEVGRGWVEIRGQEEGRLTHTAYSTIAGIQMSAAAKATAYCGDKSVFASITEIRHAVAFEHGTQSSVDERHFVQAVVSHNFGIKHFPMCKNLLQRLSK